MLIREVTDVIERFAPLAWQESYDNAGLIVGRPDDEVHRALLAVDVTDEVMAEAEREGCDMVITHHPIVFHALKRFNSADAVQRCVERAIRRGIALYACHTNLDSAPGGMSWYLADMLGIGVEAVFFPAEAVNRLDDPVLRLVPFLPADEGELLCRESDRRTFQAGGLYAQPDAVIALRAGGVLAVEYKSRGGRMDDPHDIPGSLRPKDLLQTVIGAMVLSASEGVACAPVLRTNNAVYFLRPGKTLATLLAERIGAAVTFVKPYAERSGISASDYAELCVVPAQMLSGRPVRSEGDLRGEAAHARMLR